jgi:outer membrane protein OmpA-like peptidoglycan-associated protein
MRFYTLWLVAALSAISSAAEAQPFQGLYIGAGAGYNLPENWSNSRATVAEPKGGAVGVGSIGYALGNGFRFEVEGNYRWAGLSHDALGSSNSGSVRTYGAMANVLFDIDVGSPWIYPYIGGGAGYAWTHFNRTAVFGPAASPALGSHFNETQGGFAFQAIGGLAFPVPRLPGLSLTTEYRFFGIPGSETFRGSQTVTGAPAPLPIALRVQSQYNHSFLLGLRYAFNVAAPVPVAPTPQAVPAPSPARSYLVFFDWDKATLSDRARQIIKEAADNSTHVQYTRIEVNGYTDTSGTPRYNMGLSIRRANAVKAELIKDGVPQNAITVQGFGEMHLLVPTGPNVREPQNRRVEIIIH